MLITLEYFSIFRIWGVYSLNLSMIQPILMLWITPIQVRPNRRPPAMEIPEQNWLTLVFVNCPFLKFVSKQEKSKNVYNPNTSIGMFSVAGGEKTLLYCRVEPEIRPAGYPAPDLQFFVNPAKSGIRLSDCRISGRKSGSGSKWKSGLINPWYGWNKPYTTGEKLTLAEKIIISSFMKVLEI